MERYQNPLIVRAQAVTAARLYRHPGMCGGVEMCIDLVVSPGPTPGVWLLTSAFVVDPGVWQLQVTASCGCWRKNVYVSCEPVGYMRSLSPTGAMGGTLRPNQEGTTNAEVVPSCDCDVLVGYCLGDNASNKFISVTSGAPTTLYDNAGQVLTTVKAMPGDMCEIPFLKELRDNGNKIIGYAHECDCAIVMGVGVADNGGNPKFRATKGANITLNDNAGNFFTTLRSAVGEECGIMFSVEVRDNSNRTLGFAPEWQSI